MSCESCGHNCGGAEPLNRPEVLNRIAALARRVGAFQRENLSKTDLRVEEKSTEIDLVTEIDQKSDAMIREYLTATFPDHSILTEESGESGVPSDYRWVVDPLDGTTNFAQGLPIFTVSIALEHRGEPILGAVYAPVTDELFTAIKGGGAYRNGKRMQVSPKTTLISAVLATGFPYDIAQNPANNLAYFGALAPKTRAIRRFGSAAYDLAMVADGRFDGYWELALHLWDIAAGVLLVQEAGGQVVPFRGDRDISIVAGGKVMCDLVLAELKRVDSSGH